MCVLFTTQVLYKNITLISVLCATRHASMQLTQLVAIIFIIVVSIVLIIILLIIIIELVLNIGCHSPIVRLSLTLYWGCNK